MTITLDGTSGITTPTYGGAVASEYSVPVTSFKNRIINGGMVIDQRNAGASVTSSGSGTYGVDRFSNYSNGGGVFTAIRSSVTPTGAGFINSNLLTVTTADSSIASTDYYAYNHTIEGYNIADLQWGTVSAKTVTLSFWVNSSVTGLFSVALINSDGSRCYPATYTISSANTWQQITLTVAGDTGGTWLTTNGAGIVVRYDLGSGSGNNGTANTWNTAGSYVGVRTSSTVNWIATLGATFYITGVQLEKGSVATSFDQRAYSQELAMCQRYYQASRRYHAGCTTSSQDMSWILPVLMRAIPTLTVVDIVGNANKLTTSSGNNIAFNAGGVSATTDSVVIQSNTISIYVWYEFYTPLNAEL